MHDLPDSSPLHQAFRRFEAEPDGTLAAIRRLLEEGADPNAVGPALRTPLDQAWHLGSTALRDVLLEFGADPMAVGDPEAGRSPLLAWLQYSPRGCAPLVAAAARLHGIEAVAAHVLGAALPTTGPAAENLFRSAAQADLPPLPVGVVAPHLGPEVDAGVQAAARDLLLAYLADGRWAPPARQEVHEVFRHAPPEVRQRAALAWRDPDSDAGTGEDPSVSMDEVEALLRELHGESGEGSGG